MEQKKKVKKKKHLDVHPFSKVLNMKYIYRLFKTRKPNATILNHTAKKILQKLILLKKISIICLKNLTFALSLVSYFEKKKTEDISIIVVVLDKILKERVFFEFQKSVKKKITNVKI